MCTSIVLSPTITSVPQIRFSISFLKNTFPGCEAISFRTLGLRDSKDAEVFFEDCPPLVVRQMNMVPSFLGKAKVLSVHVPYFCDNCEKEKLVLITKDKFAQGKGIVPETIPCEFCKKGDMELDGHPEQYFAFAR